MDEKHTAMLAAANAFWETEAPDFMARRQAAFELKYAGLLEYIDGLSTTMTEAQRSAARTHHTLALPITLREATIEAFDAYHRPGTADVAVTAIDRQELKLTLKQTLADIYNPTHNDAFKVAANDAAEHAMQAFFIRAHADKLLADKSTEPDVTLKKMYMEGFESLVEQLPPSFVRGLLDPQLEHDTNARGHATRFVPDHAVTDAATAGTVGHDSPAIAK